VEIGIEHFALLRFYGPAESRSGMRAIPETAEFEIFKTRKPN